MTFPDWAITLNELAKAWHAMYQNYGRVHFYSGGYWGWSDKEEDELDARLAEAQRIDAYLEEAFGTVGFEALLDMR